MSKHLVSGLVRAAFLAPAFALACAAAVAQPVRGTIERVDGNLLSFRSTEGAELTLTLADTAVVVALMKASMADIKEGTYLGSAAMPQADGSQKALEIHIFPDQMRGTGDGHRPYAPVPSGTMTNGATTGPIVTGIDGATIVVKYKDGEKKIDVPANVPVVTLVPGSDKADIKPGVIVFVPTQKQDDGTLHAGAVLFGKDGLTPPM